MSAVIEGYEHPPLWQEPDEDEVPFSFGPTWLVVPVLVLLGIIYSINLGGFPEFFDDEGTYYSQAFAIFHMNDLAPFTYWYDHPPAGWIQIALVSWLPEMLLPHQPALVAGRMIMVGYMLISALLLYILARRVGLRPGFAVAAMLFWALSPLTIYEGRQVFLDNVALPWVLGAFVLATGKTRSLWAYTSAGFCLGIAMLSKETTAVMFPALLIAVWHYSYRPTRAFAMVGAFMGAFVIGIFYPLFAVIRHELLPGTGHVSLWDALAFQFADRTASAPLWEHDSVLYHWFSFDSVLLVVGAVCSVTMLKSRRTRFIGVAALLVTALAFKPGGYLPYMYCIVALPFFALSIAAFLNKASDVLARYMPRAIPMVGVTLALLATLVVWTPGIWHSLTTNDNVGHQSAVAWAEQNLPRKSRVLVDDTYWNDMVRAGWRPDYSEYSAVWYIKIDNDPEAVKAMPNGYRDVDYIIYTDHFGGSPDERQEIVNAAVKNSTVLTTFGTPESPIEIRKVNKD